MVGNTVSRMRPIRNLILEATMNMVQTNVNQQQNMTALKSQKAAMRWYFVTSVVCI